MGIFVGAKGKCSGREKEGKQGWEGAKDLHRQNHFAAVQVRVC